MGFIVLSVVTAACLVAASFWARSAVVHRRAWLRAEREFGSDSDAAALARTAFRKEVHATSLYGALVIATAVGLIFRTHQSVYGLTLILVPVGLSLAFAHDFLNAVRISAERFTIERRAVEVLTQEQLAPKAWAARLAPEDLPDLTGFELGRVYQAGTGMMAGDFYDVFRVAPNRVAAVIGDVTGHGIEASITAFQAKYLLRVFLRQFRDPAQALEELNRQISTLERSEEFISLVVVVFDTAASTLRFASAGHPAAWLWHDREVRALRATGPLLMLDPRATYLSREIPLDMGDLVLMYTDGLAEARNGDNLFGEERIANVLRRDPGVEPGVLCKSLLESARDFAESGLNDDVAILAVRRH
ncbi:MAG: serine/threonine-protein phosphatase [Actinobacteria bacterium]|nr:serine/threonine-protein phosphatase [Actinomycetota bacterium]